MGQNALGKPERPHPPHGGLFQHFFLNLDFHVEARVGLGDIVGRGEGGTGGGPGFAGGGRS